MNDFDKKLNELKRVISPYEKVALAFSGGVDSTLLLYLLCQERPVVALTATGCMQPKEEREFTRAFAEGLGAEYVEIPVDPLTLPDFKNNTPERCYACKKMLFTKIIEEAKRRGCEVVFDGSNLDDLGDYRPGMRALEELKIRSPFLEARLNKSDIYYLSKKYALPTQNKPAAACLASRVATNEEITREKLSQIESGERILHEYGFHQVRLRTKNARYYLECERNDFDIFYNNRAEILDRLKHVGIELMEDPREYARGSMNLENVSKQ